MMILLPQYSSADNQIPSWIKNTAKWWSEGYVGEDDFVKGMQYLIQKGIIKIPQTQVGASGQQHIPQWIKNNAAWWANGQVTDDNFVKGMQYLVENNFINVNDSSSIKQTINIGTTRAIKSELKGVFVSWTGSGDGSNWSDRNNWSTGRVPASHDRVLISEDNHVTLDNSYTLTGFLKIASGGSLTIEGNFNNFGDIENDGIITIDQGSSLDNRLSGLVDNFKIINNYGSIDNGIGNIINNKGQIINNVGGIISNYGVVNNCGGTLVSYGTSSGNPISSKTCNSPPMVEAGSDQTIFLPTNSVMLNGTVTDDGFPTGGKLTFNWVELNGPGSVEFSNQNATHTKATFDKAGVYLLRLVADDSQLQSSDDVTISVRDTIPPHTIIISGPNGTINSRFAEFSFNSTKPDSVFKCSLDNSPFSSCSNPVTFDELGDGQHAFKVRSVDVFGNADPETATRTWIVDTSGPSVNLSFGPDEIFTGPSVNFTFYASKTPSTFECSLDNSPFSSCASPIQFIGLGVGMHIFSVRSIDDLGNQGTTVTRTWKVDFPPTLYLPTNQTIQAKDIGGATFYYNASAYDKIDGSINPICNPPSGSKFNIGQTYVNCSVKDNAGYVTNGTFVVKVIDTMAPVLSNMFNMLLEATNSSGAQVNYVIPSAVDPIYGPVHVSCSPVSGSVFPMGTSRVTCSAADRTGNMAQMTFFVIIRDTTPPVVIGIPDRVPDSNGFYNDAVRITWTGKDTGSGILSCDHPSTYLGPDGQAIYITGHCIDKAGNVGTGGVRINYDSTPPTIIVPPDMTVTARSPTGAVVTYSFSAGDSLSTPTIFCNPPSGSKFLIGTTIITCTATDYASNSATKTFNITVLPPK